MHGGRMVERWWNGQWGRARKDISIEVDDAGHWVWLREGAFERDRPAASLECARAGVAWLKDHGDPYDRWVDWTSLYTTRAASCSSS